MAGGWLGGERVHLARCASTNDEASRLARAGAQHGTVVTADEQTAGRGRRGRSWHSPAGDNLYLSCVLRPDIEPLDVPPIALAAGVAVSDAVNAAGLETSVKWPNDVLCCGKKLAGILAEMSTHDQRLDYVILGIGVNLGNQSFPTELAARATSISLEGGDDDPTRFTERLLPCLEDTLDVYAAGGLGAIAPRWRERMHEGLLRIDVAGDAIEGMPRGIDDEGALLVEDAAGARHRIVAGDVELVGWLEAS